jgi:hypothetical protein
MGKRTVAEMTADTLREVAVLSAVFFTLDNLMRENRKQAFALSVTIYVLIACIIVYAMGVIIERTRTDERN